ncbi:MAG: DinB family protein [Verrucomicrobia bacterium]|nr:MAG: DinB family protein [Verrucomicrobiota bacterium]
MTDPLVEDNVAMLAQAVRLVAPMPATLFDAKSPASLGASIGGHLRHVIDHYRCFLRGAETGAIDYDARERSPAIESDPEVAVAALREVSDELGQLAVEVLDAAARVRMDTGGAEERPWTRSSVRRELQFLLSHTVHHFALIAMICRARGHAVEPEFGVAPSTLRYRRQAG